jgi:CxxC motif-containing protein (DUF1111 family)
MFRQVYHNSKTPRSRRMVRVLVFSALLLMLPSGITVLGGGKQPITVKDPGVRGGPPGAGGPVAGICTSKNQTGCGAATGGEQRVWLATQSTFKQVNSVTGTAPIGLGPRFNSNSCVSCHSQPAPGGASPPSNPLFSVYQLDGAQNTMPFFESTNGAALDGVFPFLPNTQTPDGTVHQLFTVTGRSDASGCSISQPTFVQSNLATRNPISTFGDGLIEIILSSDIKNNAAAVCSSNSLGICGTPNTSGNDGSVTRFGWKGDLRSLQFASGLFYNVEMGVTNEMFPNEIDETPGCNPNPLPESSTNFNAGIQDYQFPGDPERFAIFMRFLAPPTPGNCPGGNAASCINGQAQFNAIGCVLCHTTSFTTPASSTGPGLSNQVATLYSDLVLHHMGPCLADNVVAGAAQGDMFRTPPLWGVGKRMFFLHNGIETDIIKAIGDHNCAGNSQYPASEANAVYQNFKALNGTQNQQDLINFLRSL